MIDNLRERWRAWAHREVGRLALLEVSARLGELGRYCHELTQAVVERPELVTVIAFGEREAGQPGAPVRDRALLVVDSKKVVLKPGGTQVIELENHFPIENFQVVVLANLDRVDIRGVFEGANLLGMASPVVYGKGWIVGVRLRVVLELRQ